MKNFFTMALTLSTALFFEGCSCKPEKVKVAYPETRKDLSVKDNYHGTEVSDPYRWLEDDNSNETKEWVVAQNDATFDYLSQIPYRAHIKKRLTELWNYPKDGIPQKVGDYYFFFHNNGLQNQSVLYWQKGMDSTDGASVFLDPNILSADGTVAMGGISFSDDNKYMAYSLSESGSDWSEIHVMEIASGKKLSDHIKWVKFSGASWAKEGFYYSRYDEPTQKNMLSAQNKFQKIYFHKLGDDQSKDKLIYEDPAHSLRYFSAEESDDGRYLFVNITEGTHGSEILVKNLTKPNAQFTTLFKGFQYDYTIVECQNDKAWVYTNDKAPNYRLVQVDLANPEAAAKDIIAEDAGKLLSDVSSVGGYLMAKYLDKATSKVFQHNLAGKSVREVKFNTLGTVGGFTGKEKDLDTFYAISNFIAPPSIYRYELCAGKSILFKQPELKYDPELFVAEQLFYPSKDGTEVSMFVVHRKDIKLNGKNPLYLYGYGGFNINITPGFNPSAIMFMEQGGVYVNVNLRGGGEYGEKWHHAGMMDKKQNVFDDFIAAAEYLIDKGYTSPEKIAIAGGSNGGLLVGACMTQRPELFAVAFPAVGVMDMLRYHKFTVGWGWAVEYGSSESAEQFEYLYKYSPLHNIKSGTCYPATLITTGDHDDRVVPAHSFKFAATIQAAQACENPTLIRIETKAGHGAGKPTAKRIDEAADIYSFLFWNTNANVNFQK